MNVKSLKIATGILVLSSALFSMSSSCAEEDELTVDPNYEQMVKVRHNKLMNPIPRSATIFEVNKLDDATWTNGFEFVIMEKVSPDYYIGTGGTSHEGGLEMKLKVLGNNQYLNESEYTVSSGATGTLKSVKTADGTQYYIMFKDTENKPIEIYTTINPQTPLQDGKPDEDNIMWLYRVQQQNAFDMLQGKYTIEQNKNSYTFKFNDKGFEAQIDGKTNQIALETDEYDILSRMFKFGDFCYRYDITESGITLSKYSNCDMEKMDELLIESKELTYADTSTPRFDCLSKRVYPASFFTGLNANILKLMRNEIYAKHGHKFKNKKLASYFESQGWYQPAESESAPTEIENLNIISIQIAENYLSQFD